MEKLYLEEPTIERKKDAIEYIKEFKKYNSKIHGSGDLDELYNNYEEWLMKIENEKKSETCPVNKCPSYTYFLVRESDKYIVGMINIRYNLKEELLLRIGHIGYSIRPLERRKGYNKINLYLGLLKCKEIGLDKVLLTACDNNPGSYKTILSLGGILENKIPDDEEDVLLGRYWIDVNKSIDTNSN